MSTQVIEIDIKAGKEFSFMIGSETVVVRIGSVVDTIAEQERMRQKQLENHSIDTRVYANA